MVVHVHVHVVAYLLCMVAIKGVRILCMFCCMLMLCCLVCLCTCCLCVWCVYASVDVTQQSTAPCLPCCRSLVRLLERQDSSHSTRVSIKSGLMSPHHTLVVRAVPSAFGSYPTELHGPCGGIAAGILCSLFHLLLQHTHYPLRDVSSALHPFVCSFCLCNCPA